MDAHNLATLFGPSLVHSKYKATKELLAEMSAQIDIIENIIKYVSFWRHWFGKRVYLKLFARFESLFNQPLLDKTIAYYLMHR